MVFRKWSQMGSVMETVSVRAVHSCSAMLTAFRHSYCLIPEYYLFVVGTPWSFRTNDVCIIKPQLLPAYINILSSDKEEQSNNVACLRQSRPFVFQANSPS